MEPVPGWGLGHRSLASQVVHLSHRLWSRLASKLLVDPSVAVWVRHCGIDLARQCVLRTVALRPAARERRMQEGSRQHPPCHHHTSILRTRDGLGGSLLCSSPSAPLPLVGSSRGTEMLQSGPICLLASILLFEKCRVSGCLLCLSPSC